MSSRKVFHLGLASLLTFAAVPRLAAAQPATVPASASLTAADAARLVSPDYRHLLIQQLSEADEKSSAWIAALSAARAEHRDALAFLLANMPAEDLKTLSPDRVLREIELAYEARNATPWARQVPDALFLNEVLPYASTTEPRDPWREDFRSRFAPLVKDCTSATDAAQLLNRTIFKATGVAYHATKRLKPDQSPAESMKIGFASCTGLSILLVDACRSVGVPARIVGVPMWSDNSGNHTWVEIWDGGWHYLAAAEPGPIDDAWFTAKAAKADANRPVYSVWASSFARTQVYFPAGWAKQPTNDLYAENVTARYAAPIAAAQSPSTQPADKAVNVSDGDWAKMSAIHPRTYACGRADHPIAVSGRGDDAAWQKASWTEDFSDIQGTARPSPRFRTRAKMLWDDSYLYVFAELQEPHVSASITQQNEVIFHDNDFEIFLNPDGDNRAYHEFEVNAQGAFWELTLPKPYRDGGTPRDPDNIPGLVCKVHVDGTLNDPRDTDHGWTVEVAIPWSGMGTYTGGRVSPPTDGQRWRMNFSRVEWLSDIIDGQYRQIPKAMRDEDNWVWSPIGVIDMHRPERWGVMQFTANASAAATPDPTQPVRDELMRVYYRQKDYGAKTGQYAQSPAQLGLGAQQANGLQIAASSESYTATLPDGVNEGSRLAIDETSHLFSIRGTKP